MDKKPVLFVCGASARQVVSMAASSRMPCFAADFFCDFDTKKLALDSVKIRRFDELLEVANRFDYDVCVLAGGMENHPDVIEAISGTLPCRNRAALVACRDPIAVQERISNSRELAELGVSFPLTIRERPECTGNGEWLIKQTDRSGGLGVHAFRTADCRPKGPHVYQRRVQGELISGLFIADGQDAAVLGVSRQWSGRGELGCTGFVYCGSIAPCVLGEQQFEGVRRTGNLLTAQFGLRGVFGIDFILDGHKLWVLEINPRITASAEVCQFGAGLNIVKVHVRAVSDAHFAIGCLRPYSNQQPDQFFGKAILFNRQPDSIVVSSSVHQKLRNWNEQETSPSKIASRIADVPMPQSVVEPGCPILTVIASAKKKSAVETRLLQLADEIYQYLIRQT